MSSSSNNSTELFSEPVSGDEVQLENFVPSSFKKRKVALRVAFDGTAYTGSQFQTQRGDDKSVEQALKLGLYRAGLISASNSVDVHKIGWAASSRLDSGAHALALLIGAKLEIDPAWFPDAPPNQQTNAHASEVMLHRINAHLPPAIRVVDAARVATGFNARYLTTQREYSYFLPADAFGPDAIERYGLERINDALRLFVGHRNYVNFSRINFPRYNTIATFLSPPHANLESYLTAQAPRDPADGVGLTRFFSALLLAQTMFGRSWHVATSEAFQKPAFEDALARMLEAAAPQPQAALLEQIAAFYGQSDETRSLFAWRMRQCLWYYHEAMHERTVHSASITAGHFPDKSRWYAVHIAGESFVYHQIRRMIGALGLVVMGRIALEDLERALQFTPFWTVMPLAPAGNLVLSHSACYDISREELFPDAPVSQRLRSFRDTNLFPRMTDLREQWLDRWQSEIAQPEELVRISADVDPVTFDEIGPLQMFTMLAHNSKGGGERDAVGARLLNQLWTLRFSQPLDARRRLLRAARAERESTIEREQEFKELSKQRKTPSWKR